MFITMLLSGSNPSKDFLLDSLSQYVSIETIYNDVARGILKLMKHQEFATSCHGMDKETLE